MKTESIPGLNITINLGGGSSSVGSSKPPVSPEVIKQRLANLSKGNGKKKKLDIEES